MVNICVKKLFVRSIFGFLMVNRIWFLCCVIVWIFGCWDFFFLIYVLFNCGLWFELINILIWLWFVGKMVVGCSIFVLNVVIFVVLLKFKWVIGFVLVYKCGLVLKIFIILV